jgi:hypothetical protein
VRLGCCFTGLLFVRQVSLRLSGFSHDSCHVFTALLDDVVRDGSNSVVDAITIRCLVGNRRTPQSQKYNGRGPQTPTDESRVPHFILLYAHYRLIGGWLNSAWHSALAFVSAAVLAVASQVCSSSDKSAFVFPVSAMIFVMSERHRWMMLFVMNGAALSKQLRYDTSSASTGLPRIKNTTAEVRRLRQIKVRSLINRPF